MRELKTYKMVDEKYCTDCVCVIPSEVYLKSEADKVIALLTDKANYNEFAYKRKSEELADSCRFYEDELRHQKFKRCLAMAMWCGSKVYHIRRTPLCDMSKHEYWQYENDFWQRWQKRWLELAEKFKEAK